MIAAGVALCACLAASGARAAPRPIQPPAPEFPTTAVWLNAKPLTMSQLRGGRVVVIAFINLENLNSLRALAVLKEWDRRYALDGLSVIGVHTPLHAFQKDAAAMRARLKSLGVTFPVVLDDERRLWQAYANDGWPSFYLVNAKGNIAYDLLGEAGYADFEHELRDALTDAGRVPSGPPAAADPPQQDCGAATPEIDLGSAQERAAKVVDLDAQKQDDDGSGDDQGAELIVSGRDGEVDQQGSWRREADSLRLAERPGLGAEAFLRVIYRGAQAFALLAGPRDAKPSRFLLRQDGLSLDSGNAGPDVKFDRNGQSYVVAGAPRLVWLVKNPNDSMHALSVLPADPGAGIYGLQFTDRCLPYRP